MITIKKKYVAALAALIVGLAILIGSIPTHYDYPDEHLIPDFPTYRQPDGITCGPTSTMLVLHFYNQNIPLEEVEQVTKTRWYGGPKKEVGMTAPDMIAKALRNYGLKSKLKNDSLGEVKYEISQNRPVIVLVRSGAKTWHYMVAIGYTEKEMTFSDPADATHYVVKMEHFLSAWNFDGNCAGEDYRVHSFLGGRSGDYMKVLIQATEIHTNTYITSEP